MIHHDCHEHDLGHFKADAHTKFGVTCVTGTTLRIFLCGAQFDPSSASGHPALPRRENISPFRFLRFSPKVRNIMEYLPAKNSKYPIQIYSNAMTG